MGNTESLLTDLEGLAGVLRPLARHALTFGLTLRLLERRAKAIRDSASPKAPKYAEGVERISDMLVDLAATLDDAAWLPWSYRRALLRAAIYLAQAVKIMRGEVPMFLLYAASLALGANGAFHDWPWQ
jgi:hypothetical protein